MCTPNVLSGFSQGVFGVEGEEMKRSITFVCIQSSAAVTTTVV